MRIMLDWNKERRTSNLDYAQKLIIYFVEKAPEFCGKTFCVYNVHGLLHLHEDVKFFDCSLDNVSAFSFENYLG